LVDENILNFVIIKALDFPRPAEFHAVPWNSDKFSGTAELALHSGIPLYV